jgi:hypothetical protein
MRDAASGLDSQVVPWPVARRRDVPMPCLFASLLPSLCAELTIGRRDALEASSVLAHNCYARHCHCSFHCNCLCHCEVDTLVVSPRSLPHWHSPGTLPNKPVQLSMGAVRGREKNQRGLTLTRLYSQQGQQRTENRAWTGESQIVHHTCSRVSSAPSGRGIDLAHGSPSSPSS